MCKEAKPGIHSLLPTGTWVFIHPQVSRAPSQAMVTWGHKCHHSQHPPLSASSPSFQTDSSSTWSGNPLESSQGPCPSCVSAPFWCSPNPSLAGQDEEQERPGLWAGTKTSRNLPSVSRPNPSPAPEKPLGRKFNLPSPKQSPVPIPSTRHCLPQSISRTGMAQRAPGRWRLQLGGKQAGGDPCLEFQWCFMGQHTQGVRAQRTKNKAGSRVLYGTREVELWCHHDIF